MARPAHQWPNREYESNLGKIGIESHITIKELCEKIGMWSNTYLDLNSGMLSPFDRYGEIRWQVEKLMKFFNVSLADLFPRYFCQMPMAEVGELELEHSGLSNHTVYHSTDTSDIVSQNEYCEKMIRGIELLLADHPKKDRLMKIIQYRFDGYTIKEIANKYNMSGSRIGQYLKRIQIIFNVINNRERKKHEKMTMVARTVLLPFRAVNPYYLNKYLSEYLDIKSEFDFDKTPKRVFEELRYIVERKAKDARFNGKYYPMSIGIKDDTILIFNSGKIVLEFTCNPLEVTLNWKMYYGDKPIPADHDVQPESNGWRTSCS